MALSTSPKNILEKFSRLAVLKPGLSDGEIATLQKRLPGPLPDDIREMLGYSAGFDFQFGVRRAPIGTVRFAGTESLGFPGEALPSPIDLLDDGCGNFWLVDIDKTSGEWGVIFFVCHDPPVIVVQAPDLGTFLCQVLDRVESSSQNRLVYVQKEAASRIWREDPCLIPVRDARASKDAVISSFAEELGENSYLVDLRVAEIGSGFSWGPATPNSELRRNGTELIFGVALEEAGFFERFFSGRKKLKASV